MTSHDVAARVRAAFGTRRVGHLGTLDPPAAGVLPVAVGPATRLFQFAGGTEKAYRAEITFGVTTDTLDSEGRITGTSDSSNLTEETVRSLLVAFMGQTEQRPPAFSAVHTGGKRLYQLAREGSAPPTAPRHVSISSLEMIAFAPGPRSRALVDMVCSPGTYVRSLADDIGRAAGYGAYLSFLVRTRVGRFQLAESHTLEELGQHCEAGARHRLLLPPEWPLCDLPAVILTAGQARDFGRGTRLLGGHGLVPGCAQNDRDDGPSDRAAWPVRVHGADGRLLGLAEVSAGGQLRPRIVLAADRGGGK